MYWFGKMFGYAILLSYFICFDSWKFLCIRKNLQVLVSIRMSPKLVEHIFKSSVLIEMFDFFGKNLNYIQKKESEEFLSLLMRFKNCIIFTRSSVFRVSWYTHISFESSFSFLSFCSGESDKNLYQRSH